MPTVSTLTITGFEDVTMPSRFGAVQVEQIEVVFIDESFRQMELSGHKVGVPGVLISRVFDKASKLPAWAIPWTVYGADEVYGDFED